MKSNWWTLVAAMGVIGLIIFAIQQNSAQSGPAPAAAGHPPGSLQPVIASGISPISPVSPLPLNTSPRPPRSTTPTLSPEPTLTPVPAVHVVESGDTPYAIANRYGVPVEYLMAFNNIADPTKLQLGQELRIPAAPQTGRAGVLSYEIKESDTLFALANRYGSTVEDILTANPGLEPTSLQVNQIIIIPLTQPGQLSTPAIIPTATPAGPPPPTVPPPDNIYDLSLEMINAVNTQRQNNGLPPLEANEQLTTVAVTHAQDTVSRHYFSHVTPEGKTLHDRVEEQGLDLQWVGENIQRNTHPLDETVPTAIGWFMGSAPHRNNILHPNYTHIGVGAVEGPPGWYTFVLVFGQL